MDVFHIRESNIQNQDFPRTSSILNASFKLNNYPMDFKEKDIQIKNPIKASRFATNSLNSKPPVELFTLQHSKQNSKDQLSMVPEISLKKDIDNNTSNINYEHAKRIKNRGYKTGCKDLEYTNIQRYKEFYLINQSDLVNINKKAYKAEMRNLGRELIICLSEGLKLKKKLIKICKYNRCILKRNIVVRGRCKKEMIRSRKMQQLKTDKYTDTKQADLKIFNNIEGTKKNGKTIQNEKELNCNIERFKTIETKKEGKTNFFEHEEEDSINIDSKDKYNFLSFFLIIHESKYKIIWDFILFILALYSCIILPIILCFYQEKKDIQSFELLIEFFFVLDFVSNFFTTYTNHEGTLIVNKKEIFVKYVFTWFIYDLLYTLPSEVLILTCYNNSIYNNKFKFIKWLKMFRIGLFFRNKKAGRFMRYILISKNYYINSFMKLSFFFLLFTHISSCFFAFLGLDTSQSWINISIIKNDNIDIYIASLYYSLSTVFSIGYGDIFPTNIKEKLWSIVLMIIGTVINVKAITLLTKYFFDSNNTLMNTKKKLYVLNLINEEYKVPNHLFSLIRKSIKLKNKRKAQDLNKLLEILPSNIKEEFTILLYKSRNIELEFFKHKSNEFYKLVIPLLQHEYLQKGEVIISDGDLLEYIYFVLNGCLSLNLGIQFNNAEISQIYKNRQFGDVLMYFEKVSPYQLISKRSFTEMFLLSRKDFIFVRRSFPDEIYSILEESSKEMISIYKKTQLFFRIFHLYKDSNEVKKKIKQMNIFLLDKGFNSIFENGLDCQYTDNFFTEKEEEEIIDFFNTIQDRSVKSPYNISIHYNNLEMQEKANEQRIEDYVREHLEKEPTIKRNNNSEKLKPIFNDNMCSRVQTLKNTENDNFQTICSKLNNLFIVNNKWESEIKTLDLFSQRSMRKLMLSRNSKKEEKLVKEINNLKRDKLMTCICNDKFSLFSIEKTVDIHLLTDKSLIRRNMKETNIPMSILEITIIPTDKEIKVIEKNVKNSVSIQYKNKISASEAKYDEYMGTEYENNLVFYGFNGENSSFHFPEKHVEKTDSLDMTIRENAEEKRLDYLIKLLNEIRMKKYSKEIEINNGFESY